MWSQTKTDSTLVKEVDQVPITAVESLETREVVLRQVCKPLVDIAGQFKICYVQPIPLPPHIEMLQKLRANGLDLVKIPIDAKTDMLYIRDNISRILKQCNLSWEYTEDLIQKYQEAETDENRQNLLNVVLVTIHYCHSRNIEFLVKSIDL